MQRLIPMLAIFIIAGCHKSTIEYGTNTSRPVYPGLKQYIFKPGSYWVYQQEQTLILDSLVVDSLIFDSATVGQGSSPGHCCQAYIYPYYKMVVRSTWNNETFNYLFYYNTILYNGNFPHYSFITEANGQPILRWPYNFNGFDSIYNEDTIGSLTLLNNTFTQVIKGYTWPGTNSSTSYFEPGTHFYFSPDIGIIKKEIADHVNGPQTWNLARWQLISL